MSRRGLVVVLLVVIALTFRLGTGFGSTLAAAESGSDESGSVSDDRGQDSIRIFLESGEVVTARSARSTSLDMVAIVLPDSSIRYVPAVRVRRILDAEGRDRTTAVLDRRESVDMTRGSRIPSLTWRGHPYPETRSFMITEFGLMYRLDRYPYVGGTGRLAITFDLGWMKNVGTRHAVGFSGYAMPADPTTRLGIRARYRRWLSRSVSVDVSPGVILGGEDSGIEYDPPGFVLGTTLNAGDLIAVMVDAELARNWTFAEESPPFLTRETHTDVTWRAGAKLGSGLGLLGAAAVVGLFVYIAASGGFD